MSGRLVLFAIAAAAAPFLLLGDGFEDRVAEAIREPRPPLLLAAAIALALAVDPFLPIPSSLLVAYSATQLGGVAAVLVGTVGLTAGCELGYAAARATSQAFPNRRLSHLAATPGSPPGGLTLLALAATRAVPLLAEATVFVAGATRLPQRRFLAAVVPANAIVCTLYAAIGVWGRSQQREQLALVLSIAIPVALSALVWSIAKRRDRAAKRRDDAS